MQNLNDFIYNGTKFSEKEQDFQLVKILDYQNEKKIATVLNIDVQKNEFSSKIVASFYWTEKMKKKFSPQKLKSYIEYLKQEIFEKI